jgi:hypothetical protein
MDDIPSTVAYVSLVPLLSLGLLFMPSCLLQENGAENQDPLIVPTSTKGSDFGSSFGGFGVNGNSNAGVNPFGVQDTPAAVEWGF